MSDHPCACLPVRSARFALFIREYRKLAFTTESPEEIRETTRQSCAVCTLTCPVQEEILFVNASYGDALFWMIWPSSWNLIRNMTQHHALWVLCTKYLKWTHNGKVMFFGHSINPHVSYRNRFKWNLILECRHQKSSGGSDLGSYRTRLSPTLRET
jgi:hypothetical protein